MIVETIGAMKEPSDADTREAAWLSRFHAGDRALLEQCYREHFITVERAVGRYLHGADKETVIHDVFFALLSQSETRASFRGGALASWLSTLGRNRAIDYLRRHRRRQGPQVRDEDVALQSEGASPEAEAEARMLLQKIRQRLPDKHKPVFEARFVEQLSQREAAARIGCSRTTLAYRELRVRALIQRVLLRGEDR